MSAPEIPPPEAGEPAPKKGGKKKLLLLLVPVLLLGGGGAGLWFSGLLPKWLHLTKNNLVQTATTALEIENAPPVYVDVPEIITNLNAGPRKTSFVKIKVRIELASAADQVTVTAAMPRIQDLFQTYLREMRPEELRGSIGSYRLREEFIARISIAASPVRVRDVLFTELFTE
jgi:flagellar FliL protein